MDWWFYSCFLSHCYSFFFSIFAQKFKELYQKQCLEANVHIRNIFNNESLNELPFYYLTAEGILRNSSICRSGVNNVNIKKRQTEIGKLLARRKNHYFSLGRMSMRI